MSGTSRARENETCCLGSLRRPRRLRCTAVPCEPEFVSRNARQMPKFHGMLTSIDLPRSGRFASGGRLESTEEIIVTAFRKPCGFACEAINQSSSGLDEYFGRGCNPQRPAVVSGPGRPPAVTIDVRRLHPFDIRNRSAKQGHHAASGGTVYTRQPSDPCGQAGDETALQTKAIPAEK